MHFTSSFGPSTYHTARYTIKGCDCMSMQQLSRNNFSMRLPNFFIFRGTIFGSHFWAPFLVPLTILRENLTGAKGCRFKNGPPFLGPKNCIIFDFFSQKCFPSHGQKHVLSGCPNNRFAPTSTKTCLVLTWDGTKAKSWKSWTWLAALLLRKS